MSSSLAARLSTALVSALVLLCPPSAAQTQLPDGFVLEEVGFGFDAPVGLCYLDPLRLLVASKDGRVWYLEGESDRNLVLDLRTEVLGNSDRGLLGIAADPQFDLNGWIYLLLVVDPNEDGADDERETFCRLVRYTLAYDLAGDLLADPASRLELIGSTWSTGIPSCYWSHAIGSLHFLSDGSLVLSSGDAASYIKTDVGGDQPDCFGPGKFPASEDIGAYRSVVTTSLAGKILRVDPATGLGLPDNPFFTGDPSDAASRVWALGLRNPFRFSPLPGTGPREALVVADVGWTLWEELDLSWGGENFGWPCLEGPAPTQYTQLDPFQLCDQPGAFTPPLVAYHHFDTGPAGFAGSCTSGVVQYTGGSYPREYQGALFFCDFARGWLRYGQLAPDLGTLQDIQLFGENLGTPITLVTQPGTGDLVFADHTAWKVRRLRYAGADLPPVAVARATPAWGPLPLTVDLDGSDSLDPEGEALDYDWELGDGGTLSGAQVQHQYTAPVNATARLTVTDPADQEDTAEVLISPGNTPPTITQVLMPPPGSTYAPGDNIVVSATAADLEDDLAGIPLDALWSVSVIHAHHEHPDAAKVVGLSGWFLAVGHGPGTHYRVELSVEDSRQLTDQRSFDLYDLTSDPEPHIVSISDRRPRQGQVVRGVAHVEHPITNAGFPRPDLEWDWGDGTVDLLPGVEHQSDQLVEHAYATHGDFTITLTVRLGAFVDSASVPIHVQEPRPAVAVFQPLVTQRWIPYSSQQAIAGTLMSVLRAGGSEVRLDTYESQDELAWWMEEYLDDGIQDVLVVLDTIPAALYAGEGDGSLAERWLEHGNAILWTGYEPFHEYVSTDGWVSTAGAGVHGADEVLDSPTPSGLCSGSGLQYLLKPPLAPVPSLQPYLALRAVRLDELGPSWTVRRLFALDLDGDSDAVHLRHDSGGAFVQVWSTNAIGVPRAQTLLELYRTLQPIPEAPAFKR